MIISLSKFHGQYGPGRPPLVNVYRDNIIKPDIEIPVLTALVDFFKVKRCLEIGCNTGATSAAILAGNDMITEYIGIDLPAIWFTKAAAGSCALHDPRFRLLQFENGSKDLHAGDIAPVDFVFIDGDHEYRWVGYDSHLAKSLLSPAGGIIAWHDYNHPNNPGVKQFIHEENDRNFITDNHEPLIVWVQGTTICYQIFAARETAQSKEKISNEQKPTRQSPLESGNPS